MPTKTGSFCAFTFWLILSAATSSVAQDVDVGNEELTKADEVGEVTDFPAELNNEPEPVEERIKPNPARQHTAEVREEPGIFMPNSFLSGVASKSKYRPKCTFIDLDCSTKKIDCFVLLCYGKKKRVVDNEDKRKKRSYVIKKTSKLEPGKL